MNTYDVNKISTIAMLVLLGQFTPVSMFIAPLLIGGMVTHLGFTEEQASFVISAELFGAAIATFPAFYWLNRWNWRAVAAVSLFFAALANIITYFATDINSVVVWRFLAGVSWGTSMCVCFTGIGLVRNPERVFGFWVVLELIFGAIALSVFPEVVQVFGFRSIFPIIGVLLLIVLLGVNLLPPHGKQTEFQLRNRTYGFKKYIPGLITLISLYVFYIAVYGVYSFVERIGAIAKLSYDDIAYTLSFATLMGVVAALLAAFIEKTIGRFLPIAIGGILFSISMIFFVMENLYIQYFLAVCCLLFAWNFLLPYLMSSIADVDHSGVLMVLANAITGAGLATAPPIAAALTDGADFHGIIVLCSICMVIALFLNLMTDFFEH